MRTIQGDIKPKAEQKTLYELSTIILNFTSSVFSPQKEEKYVWTLYKLVNNQWKKVENNVKYGEKNTYQFGQGVVGIPFKIMVHSEERDILQVNRNKLIAELTVVPKTAKEPVIGRVILLNKGNKDVNKAKFNEHLTAQARTSNLLGKEITFYLWEEGASEFEKYKNPKKARVNKHGIAEVQFNLSEYASPATFMIFFGGNNATKKFFVTATYEGKGETNKTPVTATDEQQQNPKTTQTQAPQHPTQSPNNQGKGVIAKGVEIIAEGIGNIFNTIENTISATQVNQPPASKQQDGTCPRCKSDFTWDEIKAIFGDSEKTFRMDCVNWINKYKLDFGIDTCAKKAHFLSQIAAETHFREKEMAEGNVKYIPRNIRSSTFGDRGKLLDKRGQIEEFCNERPDQKKLFNFLYANEHGFGNGNGNEASGDGFNFRGKGLIQLTGKGNYKSAMGLIKEYVPTKIYTDLITTEKRVKHFAEFKFGENRKHKTIKDVDLFDFLTYYDMPTEPKYAVFSALADWKGKGLSNSTLMVNDVTNVRSVRKKINVGLKNLDVASDFFKKSVIHLRVDECTLGKNKSTSNEKGTVVLVSGTDKKSEKDPAQNIYWVMYKTTVYKNITLATFKKLKGEDKLPSPDYTTYLSRDTHQTYSKSTNETFKHSDKRFGKYNEIPPGEYFLVPGLESQKYLVYVIDSESKSAGDENGINGPDGSRGGVALHHYCPRFSVGCFTFNSGKNTTPVQNFVKEIPDLKLGDNKPVHFIVESRQVKETQWDNPAHGTTKWTGI